MELNDKLKAEVKMHLAKIEILDKAGEQLKAEKEDVENNLSQLRLRSKFQISTLQKELNTLKLKIPGESKSILDVDGFVELEKQHEETVLQLENQRQELEKEKKDTIKLNELHHAQITKLQNERNEAQLFAGMKDGIINSTEEIPLIDLKITSKESGDNIVNLKPSNELNSQTKLPGTMIPTSTQSINSQTEFIDSQCESPTYLNALEEELLVNTANKSLKKRDTSNEKRILDLKIMLQVDYEHQLEQAKVLHTQQVQNLIIEHESQMKISKEKIKFLEGEMESLRVQLALLRSVSDKLSPDIANLPANERDHSILDSKKLYSVNESTEGDQINILASFLKKSNSLELNNGPTSSSEGALADKNNTESNIKSSNHSRTSSSQEPQLKEMLELERQRYNGLAKSFQALQDSYSTDSTKKSEKSLVTEEQLKDYKLQIASRQAEITSLQKVLAKKTEECEKIVKDRDEKLKKLKGLLLAANKNITDNKKLISDTQAEVSQLKETNEKLIQQENASRDHVEHLKRDAEEISSRYKGVDESQASRVEELSKQLQIAQAQLYEAQVEFQNYRSRAHAVLQQNGSSAFEKRIETLEETIMKLEREATIKDDEYTACQKRISYLQKDLTSSIDQITKLEANLIMLEDADLKLKLLQGQLNIAHEHLESEVSVHQQGTLYLDTRPCK